MSTPSLGSNTLAPWIQIENGKRARTVKSAERTLALFELFSLYQRPAGVGEIAKALGIPQPSVSMLVRNLCDLGYLEHDRIARTYVPTIRIMLLGSWIHRRFSEEHNFERRVDDLMRRLGESVLVGIQNGVYCQYVLGILAEHPDRLEIQSGLLRPITRTAVGRVLLSLKPDAEVEAIVRRCNSEVSDVALRVNPKEFREIMHQVRELGYARTAGDMTPGQAVIAISIEAPTGRMPMAIGVGGRIERIGEKELEILAALSEFAAASPCHKPQQSSRM